MILSLQDKVANQMARKLESCDPRFVIWSSKFPAVIISIQGTSPEGFICQTLLVALFSFSVCAGGIADERRALETMFL